MIAYYTTYNEIHLLPLQHEWCKNQGIQMYVLDNCSNDGTKEYLEKHKIRHRTIDTCDAFDLRPLLIEMTRQIHADKPDWFIYSGMDMFFVTSRLTIPQLANMAGIMGYNMITMEQITFYHTRPDMADKPDLNPFRSNFHFRPNNMRTFISEYCPEINIKPDNIVRPNPRPFTDKQGLICEMNAGKPIANRIENLKRRQKAWDNGMNRNHGSHYRTLAARGFIFPESEQTDIRTIPEKFALYRKLQAVYE
ncbi:MAG: hypothetical protein AB7C90_02495 [Bacteroidales bacterium]